MLDILSVMITVSLDNGVSGLSRVFPHRLYLNRLPKYKSQILLAICFCFFISPHSSEKTMSPTSDLLVCNPDSHTVGHTALCRGWL